MRLNKNGKQKKNENEKNILYDIKENDIYYTRNIYENVKFEDDCLEEDDELIDYKTYDSYINSSIKFYNYLNDDIKKIIESDNNKMKNQKHSKVKYDLIKNHYQYNIPKIYYSKKYKDTFPKNSETDLPFIYGYNPQKNSIYNFENNIKQIKKYKNGGVSKDDINKFKHIYNFDNEYYDDRYEKEVLDNYSQEEIYNIDNNEDGINYSENDSDIENEKKKKNNEQNKKKKKKKEIYDK